MLANWAERTLYVENVGCGPQRHYRAATHTLRFGGQIPGKKRMAERMMDVRDRVRVRAETGNRDPFMQMRRGGPGTHSLRIRCRMHIA